MDLILLILALGWLANLIAWGFEPLQKLKDKLIKQDSLLDTLFNCPKCVGFWIGIPLISTIWYAPLLVSLTAYILEKIR